MEKRVMDIFELLRNNAFTALLATFLTLIANGYIQNKQGHVNKELKHDEIRELRSSRQVEEALKIVEALQKSEERNRERIDKLETALQVERERNMTKDKKIQQLELDVEELKEQLAESVIWKQRYDTLLKEHQSGRISD